MRIKAVRCSAVKCKKTKINREALWDPSVQNWVWFSSRNASNEVAGSITESSPGFLLWLPVFSRRFSSPAVTSNFLSALRKVCVLCNLYAVVQVTKEIFSNSEWLVCWDRSCYCFYILCINIKDNILNKEKRNLITTAGLLVGDFYSVFKDPWKTGKETKSYFTFFRNTKGKKVLCG